MKISRAWLQTLFERELPPSEKLADALTFHAFEIESVVDDVLDVKVTPNRGHDCLSHRGIAKELSAILEMPMREDSLRLPVSLEPKTDAVQVTIGEPTLCARYIAGYIRGVRVRPSPEWLRGFLESVGQRSINNVVDATNYVMFHLGQPLHAFDAGKLEKKGDAYAIAVRKANADERIVTLDGKEYACADTMLLITDAHANAPIGIAGVKGGAPAAIDGETADIVIESANFDGPTVRRTAQALKLRTDASTRFEQSLSPELAGYGMFAAIDLILDLAGGTLDGYADEYPTPVSEQKVAVSVERINSVLGTRIKAPDVSDIFTRLSLVNLQDGNVFKVKAPFERLDISIAEDLVEEVGRIVGYEHVPEEELPPIDGSVSAHSGFSATEAKREELLAQGYSEVYTSVFTGTGDRAVSNKVGGERPYLRSTLKNGLEDALLLNISNQELLHLDEVRLFEIGTVWRGGSEVLMVGTARGKKGVAFKNGAWTGQGGFEGEEALVPRETDSHGEYPVSGAERYAPFSRYPYVVRDISMWVPSGSDADTIRETLRGAAGELAVRVDCIDTYMKGERTSLAFRMVFQSFDRTLTDEDVAARMESVYAAVKEKEWEVR